MSTAPLKNLFHIESSHPFNAPHLLTLIIEVTDVDRREEVLIPRPAVPASPLLLTFGNQATERDLLLHVLAAGGIRQNAGNISIPTRPFAPIEREVEGPPYVIGLSPYITTQT